MTTPITTRDITGRPIRATDQAVGYQQSDTAETAGRKSTWQDALNLSGLFTQYSDR